VTLSAAFLLGALALGFELPAQQTGDEGLIRVTTRLVLVDVVVTDDDGPVTDLTVEEFRLFDEGRERGIDIFTFTEVSTGDRLEEPLPAGVVSNRYDADGRTTTSATVILIDRLNTSPFDQPFADQQLHEFLDTLTDDDRVAIYELTNTLRLVQDYTSDKELLRRAMETSRTAQTIGLEGSEDTLDNRPDPAL
jgi:VWFA-related protein